MLNPVELLRQRCAGKAKSAVAEEMQVSPQYLSDVLAERREPGPKMLDALGLERVVTYRRKRKGADRD